MTDLEKAERNGFADGLLGKPYDPQYSPISWGDFFRLRRRNAAYQQRFERGRAERQAKGITITTPVRRAL